MFNQDIYIFKRSKSSIKKEIGGSAKLICNPHCTKNTLVRPHEKWRLILPI